MFDFSSSGAAIHFSSVVATSFSRFFNLRTVGLREVQVNYGCYASEMIVDDRATTAIAND
jgi:hypothetical protein